MKPAEGCDRAIRQVGEPVTRLREGCVDLVFYASIQPANRPGEGSPSPTGWGDGQRYRLYAPKEAGLLAGDTIVRQNRRYLVTGLDTIYFAGQAAYLQAALRPEKGEG